MKKILLSVIFAAIGLMTTTNVMAAAVAPSINETSAVYGKALKLLSTSLYVVEIDANGKQIEETAKTAGVNTRIIIGDETITIKMEDEEPDVLKVLKATDPKTDDKGMTSMVFSCKNEDGDDVQVVVMRRADGDVGITVHESHSAVAFMNISEIE